MPFSRPSLAQLRERIAADFSAGLLNGAPVKSRSVLGVLATAWAGAVHLMYGALAFYFKQFWAVSAEKKYLEIKAGTWGIYRKSGARATGTVRISGTGTLQAGAAMRASSGMLYTTDADAKAPGEARVTASEAGEGGNLEEGAALTLVSPASGIGPNATVVEISGGTDEESDEELRQRLLLALQAPPHGGNAADYVTWATEVEGVTRAWCRAGYAGDGTVGVTFVSDTQEGGIIPGRALVERVQEYIDARRPITADVYVFAPVSLPVDISLRISPDTAAVRLAVQAELADLFVREGEPGKTILLSHIDEAVSIATGEEDHTLIAPSANIVPGEAEIPTLGNVTFVEA